MALRTLNRLWVKTRSCLGSMDMPSHYSPLRKLENTSGKVTPVLWRKRYYLNSLYLKQKSVKLKNVSSTYDYLTGINSVVLVSFLSVLSGIIDRQFFFSQVEAFVHSRSILAKAMRDSNVCCQQKSAWLPSQHNTYLLRTKFVTLPRFLWPSAKPAGHKSKG